jgi:hypothetical protein
MIGSQAAIRTANILLLVIALCGVTSSIALGAIYFQGAKVRTTEAKQIQDLQDKYEAVQRDNKALHATLDGLMGNYVQEGPYAPRSRQSHN